MNGIFVKNKLEGKIMDKMDNDKVKCLRENANNVAESSDVRIFLAFFGVSLTPHSFFVCRSIESLVSG